jgi:hypothetical protein
MIMSAGSPTDLPVRLSVDWSVCRLSFCAFDCLSVLVRLSSVFMHFGLSVRPSVCQLVCLSSVFLSVRLYVNSSICHSSFFILVCLSIQLYVCLLVNILSVCLSIGPSVLKLIYLPPPFIHPYVCPSIRHFVCLSFSPFDCLSV